VAHPVFAVIVFAYGGVPFLRMAAPELRERAPGMMTLISMAITVAFVYSLASLAVPTESAFFWELVTLIDIMLLGHWIEMRSVRRASSALDELAKLMPDTAERITSDGETEEVPASDLEEGDLVLVRPGASVPADGVVEEGESDVNESMITGESTPVSKGPTDEVIGGTVNGDGSLRVRISATGEETTLAGIMRLVEEAQSSESKTQALADRAAGWLVLRRPRRGRRHGRRVDDRGGIRFDGDRTGRYRPRHRLSARARTGHSARRRDQHLAGRAQRDARP